MRFEKKMGLNRRKKEKNVFSKLKKLFFFGYFFITVFPLPFKDGFQNLR